ncbi:MAG: prepilin-type N-terminal cleavage/methylation domain-containing protein [Deltaproteobacteria bacterium]
MFRAGEYRTSLPAPLNGCGALSRVKGFTFIEVMVALAILSGVIVTVVTTINYHLTVVERLRKTTYAAMLARVKIEEINILGPPPSAQGDFTSYGRPEYGWEYISEDFMIKDVKKVHVTVTWGGGQSFTIETYRR